MAILDKYERQHRLHIAQIEKQVLSIYEAATREAAAIGMTVGDLTDDLFSFDRYPITHKRIEALMQQLHDRLETAVVDGVNSGWTLANNKNSELVRRVYGDSLNSLTLEQQRKYFSNREDAREAFLARKVQGLSLSDRVWRYTDLYKHEIEMGIDVGLRAGTSADELSRELRSYLRYPDKLFRRVRDEHGNLVLSQAAKAFHPGQGVYRSSYMNARRLAATETNIAYRTADYERYQDLDFVVGIEVHLSNNHNCKGVPDGQFYDICDELQGKYPKDFKFTGWHPHCRCYVTTILKTPDEMRADNERILRGEEPTEESENEVMVLPKGFVDWQYANVERAKHHNNVPYFIKDNPQYIFPELADAYGKRVTPITSISPNIPATLTAEQRTAWMENERKVEQVLGIKRGEPMTFERANEQRGNPHFVQGSGDGYTVNCQSCVVANELRRRGFDVEAWYNTMQNGNIPYELSHKTNWAWIDPATGRMPKKIYLTGKQLLDEQMQPTTDARIAKYQRGKFSKRLLYEQLDIATKEPGRYHISWGWKGAKDGHIITLERLQNGEVRFYDPQTGKVTAWKAYRDEISSRWGINVLRVDNLQINTDIIDGVVAKAGTTTPLTSKKPLTSKVSKSTGGVGGVDGRQPVAKLSEDIKQRRSEIRKLAKPLTEQIFHNPDFHKPVTITNTNIKEWIDQPFAYYEEKNEMLLNVENVFKDAKYLGAKADYHNKDCKAHIFETEVQQTKAWIIVREMPNGECHIHSISDNATIKIGIKKDA